MNKSLVLAVLLIPCLFNDGWGMGAIPVAFDPDVGWVYLNTTSSKSLVVTAHLDRALPNEEFSVSLRVRYEDGTVDVFPDIAVLSTNAQGRGNVYALVDTNPPAGSTTLRRVAVRVRRAPNPLYVAVAWDLPLKRGVRAHGDPSHGE